MIEMHNIYPCPLYNMLNEYLFDSQLLLLQREALIMFQIRERLAINNNAMLDVTFFLNDPFKISSSR